MYDYIGIVWLRTLHCGTTVFSIAQPHRFVLATSIIEAKCFHQMAHFELSITRVKYSSPLDFPLGACEASGRTSIATFLLPSLCERGC